MLRSFSPSFQKSTILFLCLSFLFTLLPGCALATTSCNTEQELKDVIIYNSSQLAEEYTLQISPPLWDKISANEFAYLSEILLNCGVPSYAYSYEPTQRIITISDPQYMPGMKVAICAKNGWTNRLDQQERKLLQTATKLVQQSTKGAQSDYDIIRALHDALIQKTNYTFFSPDQDNAIGALLNGAADCDGYADAFYLLCSLAGYDVYFQFGYSNTNSAEAHMWNGIRVNDAIYMVDVTWDDPDSYYNLFFYGFMLMGNDMARSAYNWNPETAIFTPSPVTNPSLYYYFRNDCAFQSAKEAASYIRLHDQTDPLFLMISYPPFTDENSILSELKDEKIAGVFQWQSCDGFLFICFSK